MFNKNIHKNTFGGKKEKKRIDSLKAGVGQLNKTVLTGFLTGFSSIVLNLAWHDFG